MILTRFVMTPTLRRLGNRKSYQLSALLSVFAWGGISQSWRPGSLAARSVSYVGSDSLFAVVEGGIPLETMLVKQGTEATDAGLGQLTAAIDGEASCQPALAFVTRI